MHSAMVTAVDDVVGAVVTALTALTDAGMMDNTILVFRSDNGTT